jgi:hypothetical protein
MSTFILPVPNELANQFEINLEEFDLLIDLVNIRERDFMTDFIFEGINEEEARTLEQIKNFLN